MNKKKFVITMILLMLFAIGTVFAQEVCNYYESGTQLIDARISITGKTATIEVKSYVSKERIEIYSVTVGNQTFTTWDIDGTKVIGPHGLTTIKVTSTEPNNRLPFGSSPNTFKVLLKTCE
jgi:hypothetical protein